MNQIFFKNSAVGSHVGLSKTLTMTALFTVLFPLAPVWSQTVDSGQRLSTDISRDRSNKPQEKVAFAGPLVSPNSLPSSLGSLGNSVAVTVQSHVLRDRAVAVLYVKGIPVLAFWGERVAPPSSTLQPGDNLPNQPLARANLVAQRLNTLMEQGIDAQSINVSLRTEVSSLEAQSAIAFGQRPESVTSQSPSSAAASTRRYVIQIGEQPLAMLDMEATLVSLPDTTGDAAQDALQATNRLRRLLGGAQPLAWIGNEPARGTESQVAPSPSLKFSGWASWYGPGFHGNRSANGEIFNQNAMTAAHPSLPFGTMVRVTNLDNGRSVVVRINDRGPFIQGRIIDLSAGAAQQIGMISSGIAPVSLDIISSPTARNF